VGYTIVVTPEAAAQLAALPTQLSDFVREQLARLMVEPTLLSKPTTMLQPRGQLFELKYNSGGVVVWVSVIFRFGQDEQTLYIEHVAAEFG
jgi:hypothetical protein